VKRSAARFLSKSCETEADILKVVELEMKLNEISEQYKIVAKSANSRAQQRKLEALEYNLEKLSSVQHQVRPLISSSYSLYVMLIVVSWSSRMYPSRRTSMRLNVI
jgi:hypothetical protein